MLSIICREHGIAIINFDPSRSDWNTAMGIFRNPDPRGSLYIYDYAAAGTNKELELTGFLVISISTLLGITSSAALQIPRQGCLLPIISELGVPWRYSTSTMTYLKQSMLQQYLITTRLSFRQIISHLSPTHNFTSRTILAIWRRPDLSGLKIETYFSMPWSWVTFVDLSSPEYLKCAIVAMITLAGKEVIVASSGNDAVYVYQRDPQSNLLSSSRETIPLSFHPDNVNFDHSLDISDPTLFDTEGRFLRGVTVGGHPFLIKLKRMINNPEKLNAPSWVAEGRRGTGLDPGPQPKFYAMESIFQAALQGPWTPNEAISLSPLFMAKVF
ncbi:hypothetical protein ACJ73_00133 [Blastomyces percursus]|uniref:Uncharacterized protein n=1 Tax=Blastomyces percursus TaxID=1658174 RepID=A0A1J9QJ26_9EURO|nr:hypothetical protein ACJ73_00133 [Blastomyces percursus]